MSSTINVSALLASIAKMETELAALRAQLGGSGGKSVAAVPSPTPKERKPRKKSDAPPSAWRLFADRVRALLKDNGYTGKALGTECVQFCATLKDENSDLSSWADADILGRRAAWSAPEIGRLEAKLGKGWAKTGERKAAAKAASVASASASDAEGSAPASVDKPKRKSAWEGLSEEARAAKIAKMQAGRAAKKAAKDAAPTETSSVPVAVTTQSNAAALPLPASPKSTGSSANLRKVTLNQKAYLINLESGHAWYRNADDSKGDWAGLFSKTPKPNIDFTAPEPEADFYSLLDELD